MSRISDEQKRLAHLLAVVTARDELEHELELTKRELSESRSALDAIGKIVGYSGHPANLVQVVRDKLGAAR